MSIDQFATSVRRSPVQTALLAGITLVLIASLSTLVAGRTSASHGGPIHVEMPLLAGPAVFTDPIAMQLRIKLDGQGTRVLNVDDPSRTAVARITVDAGGRFPWHTHPGPVLVNVAQGELVYQNASDCVERHYPVGTAFIDPGRGNVHTAWNPTGGQTILIATFFEVAPGSPLTITEGVSQDNC